MSISLIRHLSSTLACASMLVLSSCAIESSEPEREELSVAQDATIDPADQPITAPPNQWAWVPFPETTCRDGSSTGLAVNLHPTSDKVMIFLQSGGACYNGDTCFWNPSRFGPQQFEEWRDTNGESGVLDRTERANPLHDYNYFFVPYCSGDLHAGDASNVAVPGVPVPQQFKGYSNLGALLRRIRATVQAPKEVLLAGDSAGGFGATLNYLRVQQAYADHPVTVLDDSGPMLGAQFVNGCMLDLMRSLWHVDATVLADCGPACAAPGAGLATLLKHAVSTHPRSRFGLVSSVGDAAIRAFLGLGEGNCTANVGYPVEKFELALMKLREELTPYPNFGTFYTPGEAHNVHRPAAVLHDEQRLAAPARVGRGARVRGPDILRRVTRRGSSADRRRCS